MSKSGQWALALGAYAPAWVRAEPMAQGVSGWALQWLLLALALCVGLGGMLGLWLWQQRAERRGEAFDKRDVVWALLPFALLLLLALPALQQQLAPPERVDELQVQVTAKQWHWRYRLLGTDIEYTSEGRARSPALAAWAASNRQRTQAQYTPSTPLVVPAGVPLRLFFTSEDVLHGWWFESLGMRADVIPGFVSELQVQIDQPGLYQGSPAGSCVEDNIDMPYTLEALPLEDFKRWQRAQRATEASRRLAPRAPTAGV